MERTEAENFLKMIICLKKSRAGRRRGVWDAVRGGILRPLSTYVLSLSRAIVWTLGTSSMSREKEKKREGKREREREKGWYSFMHVRAREKGRKERIVRAVTYARACMSRTDGIERRGACLGETSAWRRRWRPSLSICNMHGRKYVRVPVYNLAAANGRASRR